MSLTLLLIVPFVRATPAHAAPSEGAQTATRDARDAALARQLFDEGVSAAERGAWDEAVERFRRAYTLRRSPAVAYNLASALGHTTRLVEALDLFRQIELDGGAPDGLVDEARAEAARLNLRVPRLTVRLAEPRTHDTHVTLDGEPYASAALDVAAPLDPGEHTLVRADGEERARPVVVRLDEGAARELVLASATLVAPTALGPSALPGRTDGASHSRKRARWIAWTCAGVAVVGGTLLTWALVRKDDPAPSTTGNTNPGSITW